MGHFVLYPNLYVILVGPPGLVKKTTAITIAKGLLYELKTIPFSGECTSKEKLVIDMAETERQVADLPDDYAAKRTYSPLTVMASELSEFFQLSGDGMVGFLTDIFDINFPYTHKTKNKGSVIINGPYLNLLAGTTPSWMTSYLRDDIITGGFTRRCLFVYEAENACRIALPVVTARQREAWKRLFVTSERITHLKGPFVWDSEALKYYVNWYETRTIPVDPCTVGYYGTKYVPLLKLTMLHAISEREELIIRLEDLEAALAYLEIVEVNLPKVFEGLGRNELAGCATRVLELLRSVPSLEVRKPDGSTVAVKQLATKQLLSAIFRDLPTNLPDAFNKLLSHLVETNRVTRVTCQEPNGPTREYIRLL